MRLPLIISIAMLALAACSPKNGTETAQTAEDLPREAFVRVDGQNLVTPGGDTLFIRGTNLGNWLNPEGYMFGFRKASSPRLINEMFCQLAGDDFTANFWKSFKDNYITRADIDFIASQGANTIRVPFHYKLFTDEDYMGLTGEQDGFIRLDSVVDWCADNGIYVILDMHDCPGGQTGDNIDDSYGYPGLFESGASHRRFCEIWTSIAAHYRNEPAILGYELMNEPIAHYFENKEELNAMLEPLQKEAVAAIRAVDPNHIILLGGAQWNSNFEPLTDSTYDDNIMFTCHRYGGPAIAEAIGSFIAFRDSTGLPMYMGEIGHNTDEWQSDFVDVMVANNIGYTFWPYKKVDNSCMNAYSRPEGWQTVVDFAESPRSTYAEVREAAPGRREARATMLEFLENIKFENCTPQESYIASMKLKTTEE